MADESTRASKTTEARAAARRRPGGNVHLKSMRSLARLREQVERAATQLEQLHAANAKLSQRVNALENPERRDDETPLTLAESPELVRQKVDAFIETLDAYLADHAQGD